MARPRGIKEEVRKLRDAGLGAQKIARVLDVTASAVYQNLAMIREEEAEQAKTARKAAAR